MNKLTKIAKTPLNKLTITLLIVVPLLLIIAIVGYIKMSSDSYVDYIGDDRRQVSIRQIGMAMEAYYEDNDAYFISSDLPTSIGTYLPNMPTDPERGKSFTWFDNTDNEQTFCIYATYKYSDGYFCVNPSGFATSESEPTSLDNCCGLPKERAQLLLDTSDWQSYRSDELGFEVKYPENWLTEVIDQKDGEISLAISSLPIVPFSLEIPQDGVLMTLSYSNSQQSLEELSGELEVLFASDFPEVSFSSGIFECRRISDEEITEEGSAILCYTPYKDVEHAVMVWGVMRPYEREDQVQKILSTFRFIDPINISSWNWRTYRSDTYGFELDYPDFCSEDPVGAGFFHIVCEKGDISFKMNAIFILFAEYNLQCNTIESCASELNSNVDSADIIGDNLAKFTFSGSSAKALRFLARDPLRGDGMIDVSVFPWTNNQDQDEFLSTANQILSTFRFTP